MRLLVIFGKALAVLVHHSEIVLGARVPLFSQGPPFFQCRGVIAHGVGLQSFLVVRPSQSNARENQQKRSDSTVKWPEVAGKRKLACHGYEATILPCTKFVSTKN